MWRRPQKPKKTHNNYAYILLDVFDFLHRVYPKPIGVAHERIAGLHKKFGGELYGLYDNPRSAIQERKALDPNYKSNREPIPDFLSYVESFIYPHQVVRAQGFEADDLVQPLLDYLKPDHIRRAILVSSDMDWARSMTWDTDWFTHRARYDLQGFRNRYAFFPDKKAICIYKALLGDRSDNIPVGIPGLKPETVIMLINSGKDFKQCLRVLSETKENLPFIPRCELNYRLVDLIDSADIPLTFGRVLSP